MQTNVAETSIAAFYSLSPKVDLEPKESRIMELFMAAITLHRPAVTLSRQQISRILDWPINSVTGRINSLVIKGQLMERGERRDPMTGRAQKLLCVPIMEQAGLFE